MIEKKTYYMYDIIHTYILYIHTYIQTDIHTDIHTLHYIALHYITLHYITLIHTYGVTYIHTVLHTIECFQIADAIQSPEVSHGHAMSAMLEPWCMLRFGQLYGSPNGSRNGNEISGKLYVLYGFIWFYMGLYGFIWFYMVLYGLVFV